MKTRDQTASTSPPAKVSTTLQKKPQLPLIGMQISPVKKKDLVETTTAVLSGRR